MIQFNERALGQQMPVTARIGSIAQSAMTFTRGCVPDTGWRFTASVVSAAVQLSYAPPGLTAF